MAVAGMWLTFAATGAYGATRGYNSFYSPRFAEQRRLFLRQKMWPKMISVWLGLLLAPPVFLFTTHVTPALWDLMPILVALEVVGIIGSLLVFVVPLPVVELSDDDLQEIGRTLTETLEGVVRDSFVRTYGARQAIYVLEIEPRGTTDIVYVALASELFGIDDVMRMAHELVHGGCMRVMHGGGVWFQGSKYLFALSEPEPLDPAIPVSDASEMKPEAAR